MMVRAKTAWLLWLPVALGLAAWCRGGDAAPPEPPATTVRLDDGTVVSATELIRQSDELLRRGASYARVTMEITRPKWSRTLQMDAWTQGASNSFIRVLEPKKDRGVTFLKCGREAWQYVPAIDRIIKIPPSMMLQSWLGSDFTNDDIVRADSLVTDYTHAVVETGATWWRIDAVPKPRAAVIWGKVTFRIRKSNRIPERIEYQDEDGELVKYAETSDVKEIEGQDVATTFTMHDATREGYRTRVTYDRLTFKPDLAEGFFSLKSLRP